MHDIPVQRVVCTFYFTFFFAAISDAYLFTQITRNLETGTFTCKEQLTTFGNDQSFLLILKRDRQNISQCLGFESASAFRRNAI